MQSSGLHGNTSYPARQTSSTGAITLLSRDRPWAELQRARACTANREGRSVFRSSARGRRGLLSEEYDVGARRLVGNFPQAFSHVALVNSAHNLARSSRPAEQRSGEAAVAGDH